MGIPWEKMLWDGNGTDKYVPWTTLRINHWANRANARGLALLGASHLNIKALHWFFIFLGYSPRAKIVELFGHCVYYIG